MVFAILVVLFLLICIVLCFLVLIQSDKGGGISGAIGGGLSQANTLLGTQESANILTKGTTYFAIGYMVLCIVLSLVFSRADKNVPQESILRKRAESQSFSPSSVLPGGSLPVAPAQGNSPAAPGTGAENPLQGTQPLPSGEKK